MPLPSFSAAGNLSDILAAASDGEITTEAWTSARIVFSHNIRSGALVWDGDIYNRPPVVRVYPDSDGDIAPVVLLANDDGLNVGGIQWHATVLDGNGNSVVEIVFDAPEDGGTINLATVTPAPTAGVVGITKGDPGDPVDDVQLDGDDLVFYVNGVAIGDPIPIPGGGGSGDVAGDTHAATGKTTPVDADELPLVDSAASNGLKKLTIANLKALIQTLVDAGVSSVIAGAPGALNTLDELAAAFGDDANFAATMTTALAGKQPVDATLTALAALSTAANKLIYATGSDTFATTDLTAAGRALLDDADAAAQRVTLALGNVDNVADASKPVSTLQAAAITAGVATQAVTDVPPLLRKTIPAPTRFPTGSKMLTAFQSSHGWTKFAAGTGSSGAAADDTVVFSEGSQSYAITTTGSSGITIIQSPALSPTVDLSANSLVLKFRADLWARLNGVSLLCSSDASGGLGTTRAAVLVAVGVSAYADDGEFVWVSVNPGDWATAGGFSAVSMAAVTRIAVQASDLGTGALKVNVQQLWTRPAPTATGTVITFDDGYLSQWTNAKPYLDKYGMKGVLFPIRDLIPAGAGSGAYMGTTELQALYDSGWDIAAHADLAASHNSTNALNDLSTSDGSATALSTFEGELVRNKKWLIASGWTRAAEFFAWPQGKFNAARLAIARKYFSLIRVYRTTLAVPDADTYPFVDGGRLRQIAVTSGVSPIAAATVTAALTAAWAAKKTVVLTFHGINTSSPQSYDYPIASFQTIIDHIATAGFPVKTLSEVMKDGGVDSPVNKGQLDTKLTIPTGTPNGSKFVRDDGTYALPPSGDVAGDTHAATGKTTPVAADELALVDSAASNVLKKVTWANLRATLLATLNPGVPTPTQSGFLGWTTDPLLGIGGNSTIALGFTQVSRIVADASGTAANLVFSLGVLGSGQTSCTFQVFDSSGALLGTTGDVKASLATPNTTGGKKIAFSAPFDVVSGATYYVGATSVGGTSPSLGRANPATALTGLGADVIPFTRYGAISGSVSSPPASITPGSLVVTSAAGYWYALKA